MDFNAIERTMFAAMLFVRRDELEEADRLLDSVKGQDREILLRHMVIELAEHHPLCDSCLQQKVYRYALGKVGNT